MNIVKKYWSSVYIYILLIVPCLCMCAGAFWTVFKSKGHYRELSWFQILAFDFSQIIYLGISLFCIYRNKKDSTFIHRNLVYIKWFITIILLIQYNFIMYLFPSTYVWECTFLFFAIVVFLFDTKYTIVNIAAYQLSILIAHIRNPHLFLPIYAGNLMEIITYRIVILELTSMCIVIIVYFAEHFVMQAKKQDEENINLIEKQLEYYKDIELLDTDIRKFRHDIDNHFICMEYLLNNGKTKELQTYFKDLQQSTSEQKKLYLSGNEIVDAILNYDLPRYCDERVNIKLKGSLCHIESVSSMDLCTLFSNLLSNAIKSVNKCFLTDITKGNLTPEINIKFSYGQIFFSIEISNTYCNDIPENAKAKTRKNKNHGYGLNKIHEVLDKYDGKIEHITVNHIITIKVYMPI